MITVKDLHKRFGDVIAVDGLSFEVQPGEVLGFLGPNGAGKSTTMKMITGFLRPTGGQIEVSGFDVEKQSLQARRSIGYLPEGAPCYGDMSVRDFLFFTGEVRELKGDELNRAVSEAVTRLELGSVLDRRIKNLSKGFKRRVGLAQAILHNPPVLILDEPTDGLDPNQKHQVRELISELSRDKILIISTHILEEVTAVCTRAIIIDQGRLVADATPADLLRRSHWHNAVRLKLTEGRELKDTLASLPDVEKVEGEGSDWLLFARPGKSILPTVQSKVSEMSLPVESIYVESGQLDDVFREITRGSLA